MSHVPDFPKGSAAGDRHASGTTSVRVSKLTLAKLRELAKLTAETPNGYRYYQSRDCSLDELVYRLAVAALEAEK